MKRHLMPMGLLLLASLCVHGAREARAGEAQLRPLHVQGNHLEDDRGQAVTLRGLNIGYPHLLLQGGHWSEDYFRQAASWGCRLVRVYVSPESYRKSGQKETFHLLDQAVLWSKKNGMYVMLDWHSIGNLASGIFQEPWEDDMRTTLKEMKEFWSAAARHYKDEPAVAFYEIFNEPAALEWKGGRLTWAEWRDMADEVIGAIVAKNPKAIPVVGGLNWCYDLTGVAALPLRHQGVVFAAHPYPGRAPQKPWEEKWERDFGYLAKDHPVMLTEFGFDPEDKVMPSVYKADEEYGRAILAYAQKKGMSWTPFVFLADPGWPMRLIEDWNYTPTRAGAFFRNALLSGGASLLQAATEPPARATPAASAPPASGPSVPSGRTTTILDFAGLDPKSAGGFQDTLGSAFKFEVKGFPNKKDRECLVAAYTLVPNGWCGMWSRAGGADWQGVDLSGAKDVIVKVHSKEPVVIGLALKDKNNNQYVADASATRGDGWEDIRVPLDTFKLDPYYTPPEAIKGAPRDLGKVSTFNIQPKTAGKFTFAVESVSAK